MTPLAAYLLLFVAVGIAFIFLNLMIGKLIRPNKPYPAKRTIYECGEPTIGSSWVQFDVRFYVVALLFVIFDVEVAFFFPWAVVFGKANAVGAVGPLTSAEAYKQTAERSWELAPPATRNLHAVQHRSLMATKEEEVNRLWELRGKGEKGKELAQLQKQENLVLGTREQARSLAWMALVEIAVFFGVLLVGYAYLWRRGDLDWVRSLAAERTTVSSVSEV
jgi:NADH-quinone oxidoreductase subunit A